LMVQFLVSPIYALTTYYVAPAAQGTGDGSSSANAAQYWNETFWSNVETILGSDDVKVIFADSSEYGNNLTSRKALYFINFGNPSKKVTLSGTSEAGTIWNHTSTTNDQDYFIKLEGCQNIEIEKMTFKGNVLKWGVSLAPNSRKPARNIIIDQCTFKNLTSSYYGALGVSDATRDVWVTNCTFNNVGVGPTAHMIYGSESRNINISGCSFTNCSDTYLKIRKDSDYWTISNSTFTSTASAYDYPFLDICTLNSTSDTYDPLDPMEYFGYHIKVNDCSFSAYSSSNGIDAVMFHGMGYDAYDYENNGIRLDATEGAILESGTISNKRDVMWDNLGIRGGKVVMYNNTFTNIRNQESYVYELAWNSTSAGWVGDADIYDTSTHTVGTELEAVGSIVNGDFEKKGYPTRYWRYNNENTLIPIPHAGLNGTAKAIFLDGSLDSHQIYQWLYNTSTNWQADICFALGAFTGTGEKFLIDIVHNEIGDKKVSIGIKDNGQIGIYGGSTFYTLSNLGTVNFSVDGNGDGDYSDAADTLRWYHLRITGDYSSTPYVNIQISDMNTYTLNANKLETNLTRWVNGTPAAGASTPGSIVFTSTYCDVVLDEIQFN
ncbi:MAG: right-handed parallel beta-helix repeat-containing protein, partial [Phycisphaerales bacterium]